MVASWTDEQGLISPHFELRPGKVHSFVQHIENWKPQSTACICSCRRMLRNIYSFSFQKNAYVSIFVEIQN